MTQTPTSTTQSARVPLADRFEKVLNIMRAARKSRDQLMHIWDTDLEVAEEALAVLRTVAAANREATELLFNYINYRGEPSHRRVRPISIRFGASEYHAKPQWLMLAVDLAKNEEREFAMDDMSNVVPDKALTLATPVVSRDPEAVSKAKLIAKRYAEFISDDMPTEVKAPSADELGEALLAILATLAAGYEAGEMREALELARKRIVYLAGFAGVRHETANEREFLPSIDAALAALPVQGTQVSTPLVLGGDDFQTRCEQPELSGHDGSEAKSGIDFLTLAEELRERTAFKYAGDCKCGKCQLIPRELLARAYSALASGPLGGAS